ncbi:MBR1 (YKL093W) and ISF1 (YMR081C) [Zygosaccharomyces parabailii]|nr:MBR1 (YKL093W) and ISF1 (YMR081C) [Zygosaccharomyces parabailii]
MPAGLLLPLRGVFATVSIVPTTPSSPINSVADSAHSTPAHTLCPRYPTAMSLRPLYMYARSRNPRTRSSVPPAVPASVSTASSLSTAASCHRNDTSQGIFERAVQDSFGILCPDCSTLGCTPTSAPSRVPLARRASLPQARCETEQAAPVLQSGTRASTPHINSLSRSASPRGSTSSIPSHLYGLERYVSRGLDKLSSSAVEKDPSPGLQGRRKSFIEMSLSRSFSR